MNRPNFEPIFTQESDFCEVSSDQPIKEFIPNQALDLKELVSRFERGQRLNVHENFPAMSNFTRDRIEAESFEDCPPDDVHDVVDVHNYYLQHEIHKREFQKKQKQKKSDPTPKSQQGTKQDEGEFTPPDPA